MILDKGTPKEIKVSKINTTIEMLNSRVKIDLSQYEVSQKTHKEFSYIFLNAAQAYTHSVKVTQEELETPMFMNNWIINKNN